MCVCVCVCVCFLTIYERLCVCVCVVCWVCVVCESVGCVCKVFTKHVIFFLKKKRRDSVKFGSSLRHRFKQKCFAFFLKTNIQNTVTIQSIKYIQNKTKQNIKKKKKKQNWIINCEKKQKKWIIIYKLGFVFFFFIQIENTKVLVKMCSNVCKLHLWFFRLW